jgi:hypothetical protein
MTGIADREKTVSSREMLRFEIVGKHRQIRHDTSFLGKNFPLASLAPQRALYRTKRTSFGEGIFQAKWRVMAA